MLIALLIVLAGVSFALSIWVNLRAMKHLAPGATLEEVRSLSNALAPKGAQIRNPELRPRLISLYTPRGWQLRQRGMLLLGVSTMTLLFLILKVVFLLPSIWR
jgi:hypothetical protein